MQRSIVGGVRVFWCPRIEIKRYGTFWGVMFAGEDYYVVSSLLCLPWYQGPSSTYLLLRKDLSS